MSTLFVDTINEKTSGNGIEIPGHVIQVKAATLTQHIHTTSTTFHRHWEQIVTITPTSLHSKILYCWNALETAKRVRVVRNVQVMATAIYW